MSFSIDSKRIIRLGDATTHDGKVIQVAGQTTVDGIPVARIGDKVACPKCKGIFPIVEGEPAYLDDDIPVALDGHKTACGAALISSL